jgi:hypothetical protein
VPGYRSTSWEIIELFPGLQLMIARNRSELVRRLADEICRQYASASG